MDEGFVSIREAIIKEYLYDVCVQLGYCLPPKVQNELSEVSIKSPEEFVKRIMLEDGIAPEQFPSHYDTMLEMLKLCMSSDAYVMGVRKH